MEAAVIQYITDHKMINAGDRIGVAVSGGEDSMALLTLLNNLSQELDFEVLAIHVNHNIRGESKEEAAFLEEYCNKKNIPFEYMKISKYGDDNFHNEARNIRYNFFSLNLISFK